MLSRSRLLTSTLQRRTFATEATSAVPDKKYKVVVVGAGPGGLSVSSSLARLLGKNKVAVVDPADYHYYQPLWTYVGGGLKSFAESKRPMDALIPEDADWVKERVTKLDPDNNSIGLASGKSLGYEYLVVAAGMQMNWDQVKGLTETLGKNGVTSNYSPESVQKTWQFIQEFKGGNALFTFPNTPVKCPGAPTKIAFLAEEAFRHQGVRSKTNMVYNTSMGKIFGVDYYGEVLQRLADERGIQVNFQHELIEIKPGDRQAIFRNNTDKTLHTFEYDFMHVAPPQGPPTFIKESKLADAAGFVDVSKQTLRHTKYNNVYALGDCSNIPTSKTAAAVAAESGILKVNLIADLKGKKLEAQAEYDGYTSCPLIVGREELILAEFSGYTGKPMETFPVDQRKLSKAAQYLNMEIIPSIYWNGLLQGFWTGPGAFKQMMDPFRRN